MFSNCLCEDLLSYPCRKLLVETLQLMSAVICVPSVKSTEKFVKGLAILLMAISQFLLLLPLQFRTWNQHPSSHNLYMPIGYLKPKVAPECRLLMSKIANTEDDVDILYYVAITFRMKAITYPLWSESFKSSYIIKQRHSLHYSVLHVF